MPLFTQRHYIWLADFLRSERIEAFETQSLALPAPAVVDKLASRLTDALAHDNPKFKRDLFIRKIHDL